MVLFLPWDISVFFNLFSKFRRSNSKHNAVPVITNSHCQLWHSVETPDTQSQHSPLLTLQWGSSPPPCLSTGAQPCHVTAMSPVRRTWSFTGMLIVNTANYVIWGSWPSRKYQGLCQNGPCRVLHLILICFLCWETVILGPERPPT